jgi:ABC-type multidrug transport system fused ATPase/permease subunit
MKFYKPDSGSIYFDDIDYNDIDTNSLRDSFGMVLQDT